MGSSSPTDRSAVRASLPASVGRAAPVAAGDLLVIVGALLAGELRHGIDPLAEPLAVLETLVPFLLGWIALALLLGVYDEGALAGVVPSVRVATGAWIGAANVGLILRQTPTLDGGITYPFPLVVTGTVLVVLVAWRVLAVLALRRAD